MVPVPDPAPFTGRPTRAEINLDAFESNLRFAMELGGEGRAVMAVLKADGYGHGALELARRAASTGASSIGVATVAEARSLRKGGLTLPLFLLSETSPAAAAEAVSLECTPVVYTVELAAALQEEARKAGRRVAVHLKIDTGMGRVGISPSEAPRLAESIEAMSHLCLEGILSHLWEADRLDSGATFAQLKVFARTCREIREKHRTVRDCHIANSALLMRGEAIGALTRPGIMLYGAPPASPFPGSERLRPVMRFVTAVAFLKKLPPGAPVSYGGTFRTERESLIATLPVGYADGYPRRLSNGVDVLVRGRRAPQVGRICMDLCMVDVTDIPEISVGDEVVLLGRQGDVEISADELARRIDTISYEVFCGVSSRVPRLYLDGSPDDGEAARSGGGDGR